MTHSRCKRRQWSLKDPLIQRAVFTFCGKKPVPPRGSLISKTYSWGDIKDWVSKQGKFYKRPSENVWTPADGTSLPGCLGVALPPQTPLPCLPLPQWYQLPLSWINHSFGEPISHTLCSPSRSALQQGLPHKTEEKKVGEKLSSLAWVCWSTTRSGCRNMHSSHILLDIALVLGKRNVLYLPHRCVAIDLFIVAQSWPRLAI